MRDILLFGFLSLIIISTPRSAWAIPDTQYTHSWLGSEIILSGPADSPNNSYGKVIAMSGQRGPHNLCKNSDITYDLAKVEYTPLAVWTGNTLSNGARPVYLYESNIGGLSLGPLIRGDTFTSGITGNGVTNSAPPEPMVVWTGNMSNSARFGWGLRIYTNLYVYKGANRIDSTTIIPRQPLFRFTCFDTNNVVQETNTFYSSDIYVNINMSGCVPDSKSTTIDMAAIPVANILNAASSTLLNTKLQTFSLKCDPNIQLSYSVVDLNDPTNNSMTSTLTAESTAAGVGYAITSPAGTRLQFGPDGSATAIPNQTKYFLGTVGNSATNNPFSYQLGFSYVRNPDEAIKTGSAKSLIGITYSYQ